MQLIVRFFSSPKVYSSLYVTKTPSNADSVGVARVNRLSANSFFNFALALSIAGAAEFMAI